MPVSDMYPEADNAAPSKDEPGEQQDDADTEQDEGDTFLAPKSAFGGDCKVGDKYTVAVAGVLEDELELKYVKDDSGSKDMMGGKSKMDMAGAKLDSMDYSGG